MNVLDTSRWRTHDHEHRQQRGSASRTARRSANGLRDDTPLSSQADWEPAAERPDPVELLIEQNATREADLVPVRHGRMTVSPFTFYRGAAKVMATDLATTPMAGLVVQLCGDAHLSTSAASPHRSGSCCSA